ncbi:MAG: sporulation protein [Saprospiraceae bacterium]|nr:sporulation protein [Saprospiraceae bacterium]
MFGTVKKILGIEGVKLELVVADKISKDAGIVTGLVKLTSLSDNNQLESITLRMVEKYSRGRGDSKLINEYPMGELVKKEMITISKNDIIEIPFEMDFVYVRSEMDKMEDNNFFAKGLVKLAKKVRGVSSEYSLRAEAKIKGTTLNPMDVKPLNLV